MRALFIGGGKSGKHRRPKTGGSAGRWRAAVLLGHHDPHDGEDEERIQRHRDDRAGMGFTTVERSSDLPDGLTANRPAGRCCSTA